MVSKSLWCAAIAVTFSACGSSGSNPDGGGQTVSEGDVCTGTAGTQGDCASTKDVCTPYAAGASSDICRVTCVGNSDCTVPGETCLSISGSDCGCIANPTDSCEAANANTLCHPDFGVCVTKSSPVPTDCGEGECADPVLFLCRPAGNCNSAPDAGSDAGVDAGTDAGSGCGADDTEGTCTWPDYCLSSDCTLPQNVDAAGADTASAACATASSTMQGSGNLDNDRAASNQETFDANSPILASLTQVMVNGSDATCATILGTGATAYTGQPAANVCNGGNSDAAGDAVCAAGEVVVLFTGAAIDPGSKFSTIEGSDLDGQFYRLSANGSGNPVALTASGAAVGAAITGHILPGAGWSAAGGPFVMARCLGVGSGNYPDVLTNYPVTLHFADTGLAGNSFCAPWVP